MQEVRERGESNLILAQIMGLRNWEDRVVIPEVGKAGGGVGWREL